VNKTALFFKFYFPFLTVNKKFILAGNISNFGASKKYKLEEIFFSLKGFG
jgi:hypothetical protein